MYKNETLTLQKIIDDCTPLIEDHREKEAKVRRLVKYIPLCPLLIGMYGSMEQVFGIKPRGPWDYHLKEAIIEPLKPPHGLMRFAPILPITVLTKETDPNAQKITT